MPVDETTAILQELSAINTKLDSLIKTNEDHEKRLRAIEQQDGKRWESLMSTIFTAVVTAILGYMLGHFIGG